MNRAPFHEAGYAPIPLRGGRPAVAGIFANNPTWRYAHGSDARFADCDVGLLCSARPLQGASGSSTLAAVSSTWIAGIRWETTDRKLPAEITAIIESIAGQGPTRIDGTESLRVFKVKQPFSPRRLAPVYFPKERYRALSYQPHRFEVLSVSSLLKVSGGNWHNGSLPEVRRDDLPTLTDDHANQIIATVERLFTTKGALAWT